ncbi:hypothetical protein VTN00DRAFT_1872 [Thermoascus crustaceus]|uniref:uncharacterized protein n=1 Tax=Thermoascus crustaceus TaxID=5088 RepID=UPI003743E67E
MDDHIELLNSLNRTFLCPDEPGQRWTVVYDPVPGSVLSHFTIVRSDAASKTCSSSAAASQSRTDTRTLSSSLLPSSNVSSGRGAGLEAPSSSTAWNSTGVINAASPIFTIQSAPNMPRTTTGTSTSSTIRCEFSEGPCATGGENLRKVISHIFGRNKNCTKLCPEHVWVHYCRKHYQRARYRASLWPFTQCDLLLDSLARMQSWGGIESFELVLRKRENQRTRTNSEAGERATSPPTGAQTPEGSPRSSAVTSPASAASTPARNASSGGANTTTTTTVTTHKRSPVVPPSPVPDWLRLEVGPNKSFDDIRAIVERLREHLTREQTARNKISFPDIEILPKFRPGWKVAHQEVAGGDEVGEEEENPESHEAEEEEEESEEIQPGSSSHYSRTGRISKKGAIRKLPSTSPNVKTPRK